MNNINKITEGNAFSINIRQAVWRTLGGVIQPLQASELVDVHLYVGSGSSKSTATEYHVTADGDTISAVMPATLKRGVYRTWLTAIYNGREVASNCDAAFEIVAFDEHYQAYAPERVDAPMAVYLQPADVTDAELEQLKAEFRAKNAALDAAKAEAEQARQEYIAKAEELENVATSEQVVALGALTSKEIGRVKELIGTPAEGQSDTLFAAINASPVVIIADVEQGKKEIAEAIVFKGGEAEASQSFTELANGIKNIEGFSEFGIEFIDGYKPKNLSEVLCTFRNNVKSIEFLGTYIDEYVAYKMENLTKFSAPNLENLSISDFCNKCTSLLELNLPKLKYINALGNFLSECSSLVELRLPELVVFPRTTYFMTNMRSLRRLYIPKCTRCESSLTYRVTTLEQMVLGTLTYIDPYFVGANYLKYVEVGIGTNIDMSFKMWGNSESFNTNVDTDEFNANFRSGIIERIYDRSGIDAPNTITLGQYAFAKLTEETIALALSKGWNIAQG